MHQTYLHLSKKTGQAGEVVLALARELEAQHEREQKVLERVEYGDDEEFDPDVTQVQEQLVARLQEALEKVHQAVDLLDEAGRGLEEIAAGD